MRHTRIGRRCTVLVAVVPCAVGGQTAVPPTDSGVASSSAAAAASPRRQLVWRDSLTAYAYTRPRPFRAVTGVPKTLGMAARDAVRGRRLPGMAAVAASTVVLIAADEVVLRETRHAARNVGLPPNHPSANLHVGPFKLAFPTTVGSGLYFLGDGLTSVGVAAAFGVRGSVADDTRARRTASEVIEALLASGTVTQLLKHVAGRQTPSEATVARGRWRPFPPLHDYNRNVPAYDAFPSGHLASTMATVTVVALNYPEHRFVRPVGYAAMGALSFAMVNNGVHWASDYPLALAIGGIVGKIVVERGRTIVRVPRPSGVPVAGPDRRSALTLEPMAAPGLIGVRVAW